MKHLFTSIFLLLTTTLVLGQEEAQKSYSEGVRHLKAEKFVEAEKIFQQQFQKGKQKKDLNCLTR